MFVADATTGRGFMGVDGAVLVLMGITRYCSIRRIGLVCLVGVLAPGCAAFSPWAAQTASKPAERAPAGPEATAPIETALPTTEAQPTSEKMQEVIAELQKLGALDPDARDQLAADLQRTDPALWPGLLHQARAVAAYRQRAQQQPDGVEATPAAHWTGHSPQHMPAEEAPTPFESAVAAGMHPAADPTRSGHPAGHSISRLPVPSHAAVVPRDAPQERYPSTMFPQAAPVGLPAATEPAPGAVSERGPGVPPRTEPDSHSPNPPYAPEPTAEPAEEREAPVGGQATPHAAEKPVEWTGHVDAAVGLLEDASENGPEQEVRLRMLYLAAERYDAAVQAIPGLPPGEQEFWTTTFHGLGTLLNTAKNPDAPSRTAEAKQVLADAASRLGEVAPLVVRNLAFCTRVHSYGCFESFSSYQFTPEQRVLLYAEVDNFTSESTARGYHTSLRSSYQIFDARGQRVADEELASTEEFCQNRRRDFFIVYDFHLPTRIYPGKHTLRLTIEDLKGQKIGESSIDLEIVGESGSRSR